MATATGHHLACSLDMPMRAIALSFKCWPGPSLTMEIPSSWDSSCSSSLRKWAGATRRLLDIWFRYIMGALSAHVKNNDSRKAEIKT